MVAPLAVGRTAVDLFAGAGGVTTGLKAAGIAVGMAIEFDPTACATYRANHPEVHLVQEDIREVVPSTVLAKLGIFPGQLGLLTACAPCQGFSALGRRRSDDPRNDLVLDVLRFVAVLQPRMVAFENVPGLRRDPRFRVFVSSLRSLGYGVRERVVNAADFNVPQRRRRLVLLALYGGADEDVPILESTSPVLDGRQQFSWVEDAWSDLPQIDTDDPLHQTPVHPPAVLSRIQAIPKEGGSRKDLPPELRLRCHEHLGSNAGSAYGRMRSRDVAPTITTRCVTPACGRFVHPNEDRAITLREAAALQTFPSRYLFSGGPMAIAAQIGNAVPVKLAEAIGGVCLTSMT